jgi:hypothetical protein
VSNRLAKEKSPYLLQHKDNPVDWYPWGAEAFKKARTENKPVFLSIGYATCHWCHVMEHESFEDEEMASLLNDAFVNIKVDREERPDIDSAYMTVCQMLNGHGGWPLTIIMTPDKEPFFASTYIPKEARSGRIGLRQLIPGVKGMYTHEPDKIRKAVESIKDGYGRSQEFQAGDLPGTEAIDYAAEQLDVRFDIEYGGYGNAPKFPTPHNIMFMLRQWKHTDEDRFLESVVDTLKAMRLGGIWDHVSFGFHRYSTDREWLLPHFEKMLYDQALLMMAYTEAWQATKDPLFKQTVFEIAEYVFRDLQGDHPAFYSAEDADSEGEEGKFYVWETEEAKDILNKKEFKFFEEHFGLKKEGNFKDEATRELTGKNIPHLNKEFSDTEASRWKNIRKKLFDVRSKRIRPLLDDKTLSDWNALMIAALAKAGATFGEVSFTEKAIEAWKFLQDELWKDGTLYHRYKDGETAIPGFADDYAFLIWAGIELYEATFDASFLSSALELENAFTERFRDPEKGAYFFSEDHDELPLGNQKQIYDGAVPTANSVAMLNLIRLARITGNTSFENRANEIGKHFSADLIRSGSSITVSMMALQFLYHDPREIIIAEGDNDPGEFINHIRGQFIPQKVLLLRSSNDQDDILGISDYIKHQKPVNSKTAVFVCRNYTCESPVTTINELKELL